MESLVLGIESSCDETAVAVVRNSVRVLSSEVSSQMDLHKRYGGVVPEVASRLHLENLPFLVEEAMGKAGVAFDDLTGIAATAAPGLIGALLVGFSAAKALAYRLGMPLAQVHHIEAHLYAAQLDAQPVEFPALGLVVSGGHTELYHMADWGRYRLLSSTRDDAAGEAFDKVAKLMGLGYPGGPLLEKMAKQSPETTQTFSLAHMKDKTLDFSFSGLKTAVTLELQKHQPSNPKEQNQLAAKFQNTILKEITSRVAVFLDRENFKSLLVGGGVACNQALRDALYRETVYRDIVLRVPPPQYCSDNAAMIAGLGAYQISKGQIADLSSSALPRASFH